MDSATIIRIFRQVAQQLQRLRIVSGWARVDVVVQLRAGLGVDELKELAVRSAARSIRDGEVPGEVCSSRHVGRLRALRLF